MFGLRRWVAMGCALAGSALGLGGQAPAGKTAAEVYKNITQLKELPAEQMSPAMQFIAASLGTNCEFCHVQGQFEADEKGAKKTAREMMAMTASINKASFGGRMQVTCNTCHNGATHPASSPAVLESDAPAHAAAPAASQATADEILAKFTSAVGGADAMKRIATRAMKGSILAGGTATPIEVLTKAPNMRVSITHAGTGDSFTAFDGTAGWMGSTGRAARAMSAAESAASSLDAQFYLAWQVKELYPQLRRGRAETIGAAECEVLTGQAAGRPAVRLYFERKSGLLLRMVRLADTGMGRMPAQIDYSDYREVDGVKTPWKWTLSRPNGRFTIQIAEVKNNVAIDDAKFARPAAEVK